MATHLRVAILASIGRNPVSGQPRANRNDVLALDIARRSGASVTLIHAGDASETALSDYLAYGAGTVEVVPVSAGSDIAPALAGHLAGFDLILTGTRSEGGEGSGTLPYFLAKRLGLPIVSQALEVAIADGHAEVTQFLPKGQRRRVRVRLPAIVIMHPMAPVVPLYTHARKTAGNIIVLPASAASEAAPVWATEPAVKKPVKLRAAEKKAGHARMLSAIAAESKGGVVVTEGSPADKAQAILSYLREHRLIDF